MKWRGNPLIGFGEILIGLNKVTTNRLYWGTLVPDHDFVNMTILGTYRLYLGTLVPDGDFGKMTKY